MSAFGKGMVIGMAVIAASAVCRGELVLGFEAYPYVAQDPSEASLPYRLFAPRGYTQSTEYPLIVYLHGAGQRGSDNRKQILEFNEIVVLFTSSAVQTQVPHFLVAPQCPDNQQWVDVNWALGSYSLDRTPVSNELKAVRAIIMHLCNTYSIDKDRIFVTGGSMGGYGCWDMVMRYPDLLAGAIPMCGAGDPSKAAAIKNAAFWIWHGTNDGVVPPSGSKDMYDALKTAGCVELKYNTPVYGHFVWEEAAREPGLADWLLSHGHSGQTRTVPIKCAHGGADVPARTFLRLPLPTSGDGGVGVFDLTGRRTPTGTHGIADAAVSPHVLGPQR